ncbi:hypothetical protein FZEAL_5257 [Fusarium zealandicum]|uniref:Uncharacterized protein n=1 Tax=Fusarium zealandicum TaxID=1053134 RepID=A0A8H4XKM6_9HYPO|nr:hypothetical protein FZEAL_5257 [Fusarium zealandicum]
MDSHREANVSPLSPANVMPPPPLPWRAADHDKSTPKQKFEIKYRVKHPPKDYRYWDPKGAFDRMTMVEFEEHLNSTALICVRFLLKGLGVGSLRWDDEVDQGDDAGFQAMKEQLRDAMRGPPTLGENRTLRDAHSTCWGRKVKIGFGARADYLSVETEWG